MTDTVVKGVGDIDLLKNLSPAALESFRAANGGRLVIGVDVNEAPTAVALSPRSSPISGTTTLRPSRTVITSAEPVPASRSRPRTAVGNAS